MEERKESLYSYNTLLDKKLQFECETVISNKLPEKSSDDYLNTSEEINLENNELINLKSIDQNESVDFGKEETYVKSNNEILDKESEHINIKEVTQSESTPDLKEASDTNSIDTIFNENAYSDISSSDKEVLQSRQPVQNNVYEDEHGCSTKSDSFASVSDNASTIENDLETNKRPIILKATVCNEQNSVNYKTIDSNSKINEQEDKSEYQEMTIGKANCNFFSIKTCNSPPETESNNIQKLTMENLNFDERRDENEIPPQREIIENDKSFNQNKEITHLYSDSIIEDFLNGSFDISAFIPEKKSTTAKDKTITDQCQKMKEKISMNKEKKYNKSANKQKTKSNKKIYSLLNYNNEAKHEKTNETFSNSSADSAIQLKRKILQKQTENYKKVKLGKSKNDISNTTPDSLNKYASKIKTRLGNKYSKAKNQYNRINKPLKCTDEDKAVSNNFDKKEKYNRKKNKTNAAQAKTNKDEEIFKGFSFNIAPVKKQRNLRSSSMIASKKIKEIGKLENSESIEEVLLDSDTSCFDFNAKNTDDCFKKKFKDHKNIGKYKQENKLKEDKFQNEDMDIDLLDDFQSFFEKEEKKKRNRISKSNKKQKNKIETTLDGCYNTKKPKLKMDNVTTSKENFILDSNLSDFFENEITNENHHNKRKADNRQQNKKTDYKLLEQGKSINKLIPWKSDTLNKNYAIITRSKAKTWDMLEKELLGESNDVLLSNNVTKSLLLKEQTVKKQIRKDVDLYSISSKSVIHTVSMPTIKNKSNERKYLQNPANYGKSNEIMAYKTKNIVERTIAAMEKCTERFIMPKECITEKDRLDDELEFDVIYDINIDPEAEFHPNNMTFVTNKNEQYYKNEIVTILKQSNSMKKQNSSKNIARATYKSGKYKQSSSDAEHFIKKSIVTESYSAEDKEDENINTESHVLIPSTDKKLNDPWGRLITELNLEQCQTHKSNSILNEKQNKKPFIYTDTLKEYNDQNKDEEQQRTIDLDTKEFYIQDEIQNEDSKPDFFVFDKILVESNHTAIFNDLNAENNYTNNEFRVNNSNTILNNAFETEEIRKTTKKDEIIQRKALLMIETKKSPKYKIQVEDNGRMKFKQCNRSLSSSSEETVKPKRKYAKWDKFTKNQQEPKREKYKRYLNDLFEKKDLSSKEKIKEGERTMEFITDKESAKKNLDRDKTTEQRKMNHLLIAKNDNDVFSMSSSDSETVNKGKGLLCDMFDE